MSDIAKMPADVPSNADRGEKRLIEGVFLETVSSSVRGYDVLIGSKMRRRLQSLVKDMVQRVYFSFNPEELDAEEANIFRRAKHDGANYAYFVTSASGPKALTLKKYEERELIDTNEDRKLQFAEKVHEKVLSLVEVVDRPAMLEVLNAGEEFTIGVVCGDHFSKYSFGVKDIALEHDVENYEMNDDQMEALHQRTEFIREGVMAVMNRMCASFEELRHCFWTFYFDREGNMKLSLRKSDQSVGEGTKGFNFSEVKYSPNLIDSRVDKSAEVISSIAGGLTK